MGQVFGTAGELPLREEHLAWDGLLLPPCTTREPESLSWRAIANVWRGWSTIGRDCMASLVMFRPKLKFILSRSKYLAHLVAWTYSSTMLPRWARFRSFPLPTQIARIWNLQFR